MARATQGLQIALIVSVMLNVVLGVTTYLYNKQAFEKTNAASQAQTDQKKADTAAAAAKEIADQKGKIIGLADLDIDQLNKKLLERQQEVGLAPKSAGGDADQKPAGGPGYDQIVDRLLIVRGEQATALKNTKDELTKLFTRYQNLEAAGKTAFGEFEKGAADRKGQIATVNSNYQEQTNKMATDQANVVSGVKQVGAQSSAAVSRADARATALEKALRDKDKEIEPLVKELSINRRKEPDPPSGVITFVSPRTKTVWIDKGRADHLPERLHFTVYAAESNSSAKAVEKGAVEVTRVLDDHRAECRIVDEKSDDPMMPGDTVFTAFWVPGQPKHFAFSGSMNLDGDGHNQVKAAIELVKNYGGVVDCWLDDQWRKRGTITPATDFIVHGDAPNSASKDAIRNSSEIERDADHYKVPSWSLADFKQKLNYQKTSSLERFGAGSTSVDSGPAATPPKTAPASKAATASKAADEFKP